MENNVIEQVFGKDVFNDEVMQAKLPKDVYKSWKKTLESGADLDIEIANVVAHAMKEWALEHGATHYTHWFQPMTGVTAEKHDSFLSPASESKPVLEFSGKELIKGEGTVTIIRRRCWSMSAKSGSSLLWGRSRSISCAGCVRTLRSPAWTTGSSAPTGG